jgi:hypothetical protein
MDLAFAFLSRYAEVGRDGCFSAIGSGFDAIGVDRVPCGPLRVLVIARINFAFSEIGEHKGHVSVDGECFSGTCVAASGAIGIEENQFFSGTARAGSILAQFDLMITQYGTLQFRVFCDDRELGLIPLKIRSPWS